MAGKAGRRALGNGIALRAKADARHRFHHPDRVGAHRRLGRQHHGVSAVHDGVGDVEHLGARRHRVLDHRLHHLRGRDAGTVQLAGDGDDAFLHARQFSVADFDAKIAARHHHRVGRLDDAVECRHRFGALDLGDDARVAAGAAQQFARELDVECAAHERHGQVIDLQRRRGDDVLAVLGGQRAGRQPAALLVDALVVG